jgi:Restriction endonuclease
MYAPTSDYSLTAPSRDGGRDAYGYYKLGSEADPIRLDFALEAKCYGPDNGVGVRELSRLISRLRHRQFGVLVTTSYLAPQAYEELRDDDHPVVGHLRPRHRRDLAPTRNLNCRSSQCVADT